jgi:hypothetical protein
MYEQTYHYARSFSYENFMRRAFKSERNFSRGIDNSVYLQLHYIANGHSLSTKNYSKQFEKIRKFLLKGTDKVLKWKLTDIERSEIEYNASLIFKTSDEEGFHQAINSLIDATQRFKEY